MGWAKELINLKRVIEKQSENLEVELLERLPEKFITWWDLEGKSIIGENLLKRGVVVDYIITDPTRFNFTSLKDLKWAFVNILQPAWKDFAEIHVNLNNKDVLKILFTVV